MGTFREPNAPATIPTVSIKQLSMALGCSLERAGERLHGLLAAFRYAELTTVKHLAYFLAQIGHETLGLHYTQEIWGPTPAQLRYEGRADLGNTHVGDGHRFMGRGDLQTTGRANYVRLRDKLRAAGYTCPDFEARPQDVSLPEWCSLSAAVFWKDHGLNSSVPANDFIGLTRKINGGKNGLADRELRLARCLKALS